MRLRRASFAAAVLFVSLVTGCGSESTTVFEPGDQAQNRSAPPRDPGEIRAGISCIPRGGAPDQKRVLELRQGIERGLMFRALSTRATWTSCSVREESGKLVLDYGFSDNGQLHVERDARIEFSLQEVRFGTPVTLDALDVLRRAESAAFGADGCGIDWTRGETETTSGSARETTYRGDVCSCQARVRNDGSGRVTGLVLRSAC